MPVHCPTCEAPVEATAKFCLQCGHDLLVIGPVTSTGHDVRQLKELIRSRSDLAMAEKFDLIAKIEDGANPIELGLAAASEEDAAISLAAESAQLPIETSPSEAVSDAVNSALIGGITRNPAAAAAAAGSNTHHTSIFNRNWPQYDGTGSVDTIGGDSTTPVPLKKTSTDKNVISDLTAIDVTIAKMDEDLALIGLRTGFKATVKNECTVVLTRKKTSPLFELLFNQARCGVMTYTNATDGIVDLDNATPLAATMKLPVHGAVQLNNSINATHTTPTRNFGYRMHIELKESSETMTLQNLCITDYAVNITADGVTEETITLYGFVQPKIDAANGGYATATSAGDL